MYYAQKGKYFVVYGDLKKSEIVIEYTCAYLVCAYALCVCATFWCNTHHNKCILYEYTS